MAAGNWYISSEGWIVNGKKVYHRMCLCAEVKVSEKTECERRKIPAEEKVRLKADFLPVLWWKSVLIPVFPFPKNVSGMKQRDIFA